MDLWIFLNVDNVSVEKNGVKPYRLFYFPVNDTSPTFLYSSQIQTENTNSSN